MGLGNQNTEGNKKSNFRWQYAMLLALGRLAGVPQKTITKKGETLRESLSGGQSTPDVYEATFFNAAAVDAKVFGTALKPNETITFTGSGLLLTAIPFNPDTTGANTGDLLISMVIPA